MTQGYDASTIRWTDGVVGHDPTDFSLERVETPDGECWAYADRAASLSALLADAVERAPDRAAFVYPEYDRTDTYREFADRVERIAAGLADAGVGAG
ncbi:MAG: AMP-binding protein, partial [Haloarculaceae archaeon]